MKEEKMNNENVLKNLVNENDKYKIDLKEIVDLKFKMEREKKLQ